MIKSKIQIIILLFLPFICMSTTAEISVIVNLENSSEINKKDIKRMFLGKTKKYSNGSSVIAINLASGNATRVNFEKNAVGKSASKMKAYWAKLMFSGKGSPPKEVDNEAEAISLVAENPAVIGYIDSSKVTDKVRVIGQY